MGAREVAFRREKIASDRVRSLDETRLFGVRRLFTLLALRGTKGAAPFSGEARHAESEAPP
jgi:hypothetical protein